MSNLFRKYRFVILLSALILISTVLLYCRLPNRHQAIIKTYLLHHSGLVDSRWGVSNKTQHYKMISPSFLIDGIYKSMEGPKSSGFVQLSRDSSVLYITGFKVRALTAKNGKRISNDFICHTNIDFNDVKYYSGFGLENRIGKQYPRMTSLSNGMEAFRFPDGYGIPMKGNDLLYVTTESLNHNLPDANFFIKHEIQIDYQNRDTTLKPLMSRTVYIMLPYDRQNPYKCPTDPGKDYCIPVETRNHSYDDEKGNKLSGHWVIPTGRKIYRSNIDSQLLFAGDSMRLHAAAVHVHPFATSLTIWDKTSDKAIFRSRITNHQQKIGLSKIDALCSEMGIWMHRNHRYELVLEADNTSEIQQDMMASMFLFFYDEELDHILQQRYKDQAGKPINTTAMN